MMKRYVFSDAERTALEKLRVPLAVYQFLNKRVVTILVSDGFVELLGYESREKTIYAMDNNMYEDTHPDDKSRISDAAVRFAVNGGGYNVVYRSRSVKDGDYRILHAIGEHVYTEDGTRLAYVWYMDEGLYSDQSHNKLLAEGFDIRRAIRDKSESENSSYDVLTGLPTMSYFIDLVNQWRRDHRGGNGSMAVVYINLSGMKHYNSQFGFAEGDNLLRRFALILERQFGHENCSRFSSDHFCVFTPTNGLEERLEQVFTVFKKDKAGPSLPVRVGIYPEIYGILGVSSECDRAKYACDLLINTRISDFRYYEKSMLAQSQKRHYYIDNLNRAIKEGWIQVHYQPIIRTANRRVSDEEALARWNDPVRGMIPPSEFIPVLEEAKLIYKLDLCVLEQVLEKIKIQEREGLYVVPTSINLSRSDFDACDIVEEVRRRVDAAGVSRSLINIEVTESRGRWGYKTEGAERPVRARRLGAAYEKEAVITAVRSVKQIRTDLRDDRRSMTQKLEDIRRQASTVRYLQDHGITDISMIDNSIKDMSARNDELKAEYAALRNELKETNALIHYRGQLFSNRQVYLAYRRAPDPEAFREQNYSSIALYEAADRFLRENAQRNERVVPSLQELRKRKGVLESHSEKLQDMISAYKAVLNELGSVRNNVEAMLGTPARNPSQRTDTIRR